MPTTLQARSRVQCTHGGPSIPGAPIASYSKPALDFSAQITRLQSIGLCIPDLPEAERVLRFIGYFRLKGYFLSFMAPMIPGTPRMFRSGVAFGQIIDLYQFDRELRVLVMDEIERLEVAIRAVISNELSLAYGPHWFLANHDTLFLPKFDVYKFLAEVQREAQRSKDVFMRHYFNTYDSPRLPPSWVTAECLSFGKWSQLYDGLKVLKNAIARRFVLPSDVFGSWLHALTVLRNICAHHGRVWNRHYSIRPKVLQSLAPHFSNAASFYALAVIIRHLTRVVDTASDFPTRLGTLCAKHPGVPVNLMGFPVTWTSDAFWQP